MVNIETLANTYFCIKEYVIKKGYSAEIDWQEKVDLKNIRLDDIFREIAWVILTTGFKTETIANKFNRFTKIFYNWDINKVTRNRYSCKKKALKYFNNKRKIDSIISAAQILKESSIKEFKNNLSVKGIDYLELFPYIGPVTKYHLAKNLGLKYSKPDRHLKRIAKIFNYSSSEKLCFDLSNYIDENIAVVDLVIWRYAVINKNYEENLELYLNKFNGKDNQRYV